MLQHLDAAAKETQSHAYAKGMWENFSMQWGLYFNFCHYFKVAMPPAQAKMLVLYMQFLAFKLKALSSIRGYMAELKTLHELLNLDVKAFNSMCVKLMWMGLDKTILYVTRRATSMSPEILLDIKDTLNLQNSNDIAFWALCLVAFFVLARKSNLVPDSQFDAKKQLARKHLSVLNNRIDVTIHEDPMVYPLYWVPGSKMCPYTAVLSMLCRIPGGGDSPCFMWENKKPITYSQFTTKLCRCLKLAGYDPSKFSSHSFCLRGLCWAARAGVPKNLLKILGGWHLEAYQKYLEFPTESRQAAAAMMICKIMQRGW